MKNAKKKSEEPTLGEVLAVMNERFNLVERRIDQRFGAVDQRLNATNERLDNVDARLGDVQRRLGKVEGKIEDIQDDLTSALHAVDKDSVTIIDT